MNTQLNQVKINSFDYYSPNDGIQIARIGENPSSITRIGASIEIDFEKLSPILLSLNKYSVRIYFYLLNKLESSDKPIIVHNTTIKKEATDLVNRRTFETYLRELLRLRLIFHPRDYYYYINPVYAWKGSYKSMFDADRLPFIDESTLEESVETKYYAVRPS